LAPDRVYLCGRGIHLSSNLTLNLETPSEPQTAVADTAACRCTCFPLVRDEDLVGLALSDPSGDIAYSILVERHERAVRHVARGILGRSADVDDVVQQTFVSAFRSLRNLKDRSRFKYWLRIIAANEARDIATGSDPVAGLEDLMILPERSKDRLPADFVEVSWLIDELSNRLPKEYMRILYLRYYLDYTVNEVAEMLGIRPGLVKWRANRARRLAKEALSDSEGGNTSGQTESSQGSPKRH